MVVVMTSLTTSLQKELDDKGYLSLVKFTKYLKVHQPQAYISYPTALKLVAAGKLKAMRVGSSYRILKTEAERWVTEGNADTRFDGPYPTY